MKSNYKIFTAVFLSAIMTAAGEYSCHIDRYGSAGWRDWNRISGTA